MKKTIDENMQEMSNISFECECGNTHSARIDNIITGNGVINQVPNLIKKYKNILMVSDQNTYAACGEELLALCDCINIRSFVFKDKHIDANLHYTGRLLVEVDPSIDFILAVGSGVINDMCRTVSYRCKIPYAIVATAPSMDGFASTISPTFIDGNKFSVPGTNPVAIIGDYDIMIKAPDIMIKSGFGDVLGKIIATSDWTLGMRVNNENQCNRCKELILSVYKECVDNAQGVKNNTPKAVESVFGALVLSGIVISLYEDSRPASGCEHFFGHYWDIAAIITNRQHPLHGISVGVGSYIAARIYEMMNDYLPKDFEYPKADYIKDLLLQVGAPTSPVELELTKEEFNQSIKLAWLNKPQRYTVLQFAREKGRLDEIADTLTKEFY